MKIQKKIGSPGQIAWLIVAFTVAWAGRDEYYFNGYAQTRLEQIVAGGQESRWHLQLTRKRKHANSHASPLCVGGGFPTVQAKAEGEEIARRPGIIIRAALFGLALRAG